MELYRNHGPVALEHARATMEQVQQWYRPSRVPRDGPTPSVARCPSGKRERKLSNSSGGLNHYIYGASTAAELGDVHERTQERVENTMETPSMILCCTLPSPVRSPKLSFLTEWSAGFRWCP